MADGTGPRAHRAGERADWRHDLHQPVVHEFPLRVPTLPVIGTRDRTAIGKTWASPEVAATLGNYEVFGKRAASAIPGARLVELSGIGHLPQVEAAEAWRNALLDFLEH